MSNGPGDPEPCTYAIEAIKTFIEHKVPLFGICLGHQLLGLASGAQTIKMKFGHHGGNHPVLDKKTGKIGFEFQQREAEAAGTTVKKAAVRRATAKKTAA